MPLIEQHRVLDIITRLEDAHPMQAILLLDLCLQSGTQLWHALVGPVLAVCRVVARSLSSLSYGLPRRAPKYCPCKHSLPQLQ